MIISDLLHFIKHQLLVWSVRLADFATEALFVDWDLISFYTCKYTNGLTRESDIETAKKVVLPVVGCVGAAVVSVVKLFRPGSKS